MFYLNSNVEMRIFGGDLFTKKEDGARCNIQWSITFKSGCIGAPINMS